MKVSALIVAALLAGAIAHADDAMVNDAPEAAPLAEMVPVGWIELDRLVARETEEGAPFRVSGTQAYGDPSAGVYALRQHVEVSSRAASVEGLHKGFAGGLEVDGFTVGRRTLAAEGDRAVSTLTLEGHGVRGLAALISAVDSEGFASADAITCFWNPRDEENSRSLCNELVKTFESGR